MGGDEFDSKAFFEKEAQSAKDPDGFDFTTYLQEQDRLHGPIKQPILDTDHERCKVFDFSGIDAWNRERKPEGWEFHEAYSRASADGGLIDALISGVRREELATVRKLCAELAVAGLGPKLAMAMHSPLQAAMRSRRVDIVRCLLKSGAEVGCGHVASALENNDTVMLQAFLHGGWNINGTEWGGEPPMCAIIENRSLVAWFLAHGANPNARGWLDITPLSHAVRDAPFEIVKLLFQHGGSATAGQLLHYAVFREQSDALEVLDYLLHQGAQSLINNIQYQNAPECLPQSLVTIGTPLHDAVHRGDAEIVRFLLAKGAHPLVRDTLGLTAMQRGEIEGHTEMVALLRPITDAAAPFEPQFTDGYRLPGWERWGGKFRRASRM